MIRTTRHEMSLDSLKTSMCQVVTTRQVSLHSPNLLASCLLGLLSLHAILSSSHTLSPHRPSPRSTRSAILSMPFSPLLIHTLFICPLQDLSALRFSPLLLLSSHLSSPSSIRTHPPNTKFEKKERRKKQTFLQDAVCTRRLGTRHRRQDLFSGLYRGPARAARSSGTGLLGPPGLGELHARRRIAGGRHGICRRADL